MAATIKDVAKLAGVSHSTVSRVLNDKGVISDETKQRIYSAMEELKYVPNDFARNFANGNPLTIALVIDVDNVNDYSNSFFSNTVFGIETAAHNSNYSLMVLNGSASIDGAEEVKRLAMGKRINGIIFPESIVNVELLKSLDEQNFPYVILGRSKDIDCGADWVDINNTQAGAAAVKHLLERGYKKIAFMSDGKDKVFNQDRIEGYRKELKNKGITIEDNLIVEGKASVESGMELTKKLLKGSNHPDAIICSNDRMVVGVLRTAKAEGITIPDKLGIVCCDNTPVMELLQPSITCINVDTYELGIQAADKLINSIENTMTSVHQTMLSTSIISRDSTAKKLKGANK
ncbi:MAG: LacI family DNA-binding transcriptional regulator [Erysipelotrichaceae bacterium]|nr:LacI family DNA-binding transcriptional regulator [Erysipelotrichaceae bacterium]